MLFLTTIEILCSSPSSVVLVSTVYFKKSAVFGIVCGIGLKAKESKGGSISVL